MQQVGSAKDPFKEQVLLLKLTKSGGAWHEELSPDSNSNGCLLEVEHRLEQILGDKFFLHKDLHTYVVSFPQVIMWLSRWKTFNSLTFCRFIKNLTVDLCTWFRVWINLSLLTTFMTLFLGSSSVFFCPVHEFPLWFWDCVNRYR